MLQNPLSTEPSGMICKDPMIYGEWNNIMNSAYLRILSITIQINMFGAYHNFIWRPQSLLFNHKCII